jgi:AhpC/TSA family/Disulphide bond corrector protein DsbC
VQLVELQRSAGALAKSGLGMASISYDSLAVLARFVSAHQITFPLLSDKGSAVIRRYGILNTNIPRTHMFYGIPFPGEYLVAPDGRVVDKVFLPSFQDRGTASEVLLKDFGAGVGGDAVEVKSDETRTRIRLSDSSAFPGQELAVGADFAIEPGWHIYGRPLPKGYVPTTIRFDAAMVAQQSFDFPKPTPIRFVALGETLPAYTGGFKAIGRILLKEKLAAGEHKLDGELKFQECNDQICKLPQTVRFEIPINIQLINE